MQLQVDRQNSFGRGMRDSAAPTEYAIDEVALLLNGRPSRVGKSLVPRGGSRRTHPTALNGGAQGYGAIEYANAARQRHYVVMVGAKWYKSTDEGATWSEIGLPTGAAVGYWSLQLMRVGGQNRIIGANGGPDPVSWAGSGAAIALSNWPTGIRHLAVFNDRLYGTDGSITVLGSKVDDPATIATASGGLSVRCQAHDDDPEITGLWVHGQVLLVFKRRSMGYLDGFGYNTITVQTGDRGLSRSVGCIAHRTIAPAGDGGVCWLSERGIEYLGPGSLSPILVSAPLQGFMDDIGFAGIRDAPGLPCGLWWERREEYWLAAPTQGVVQNTHIVVFRPPSATRPPALWLYQGADAMGGTVFVNDQGNLEYSSLTTFNRGRVLNGNLALDPLVGTFFEIGAGGNVGQGNIPGGVAAMFVGDRSNDTNRPHYLGFDGYLRHMETGTLDDVASDGSGGAVIEAKVRSRPFIYGDPLRNKAPLSVRVSALPEGSTSHVNVRLFGDGRQIQQRMALLVRGSATRPRAHRIRMGGSRASAIQVEIEFRDRVIVQALEAAVRTLDEHP